MTAQRVPSGSLRIAVHSLVVLFSFSTSAVICIHDLMICKVLITSLILQVPSVCPIYLGADSGVTSLTSFIICFVFIPLYCSYLLIFYSSLIPMSALPSLYYKVVIAAPTFPMNFAKKKKKVVW